MEQLKVFLVIAIICASLVNAFDDDSAIHKQRVLGKIKDIVSKVIFNKKCIGDLGCFYNGPPFYNPVTRPLSPFPAEKLDTEFILFTPNRTKPQILTDSRNSLKMSILDPRLDTKIIIHGYVEVINSSNIYFDIKDELMEYNPCNVMIVNWTASSVFPYHQAVANARAVGAQVAKFINYHIRYKKIKAESVHVIGHSLGGQMSGYVGERVRGLGRITALDPAGPFFYKMPKEVALDPSDAKFVDVIHTDGGNSPLEGLGLMEPVGHMDFYPNGGQSQPGCTHEKNRNLCEHQRSRDYFKESIKTCKYSSVQCRSYDDFTASKCLEKNSRVSEMGYHATKLNVPKGTSFYLQTSTEEPYCGKELA